MHESTGMTKLATTQSALDVSAPFHPPHGRRRFFFVVNQRSGNYFKWVVQLRLGEFLTREGVSGEVHYLHDTETLRQELTRAYDEGHRDFVVVGGDGTVSLVASLLHHKDCRLGIVPVGTTNMLAQLLTIPLGTRRALELLLTSRQTRCIDALAAGERLFFLNASAGLSSFSISDLRTAEKSYFKLLAYVFAVARSMRKAKTRRFTVETDGRRQTVEAAELFIDNAGALWTPRYRTSDARLDDGLAEVCYVTRATPRELGNAVLDVLLVRKRRAAVRHLASARSVTVDCEEPIPVQADGDAVAFTPVELKVIPSAVCFIVPEKT